MTDIQHPLQRDLTAGMRRGKIVGIEEAVDLIQDNDVIGFNGIIGIEGYSFNNYKLQPRSPDDFQVTTCSQYP